MVPPVAHQHQINKKQIKIHQTQGRRCLKHIFWNAFKNMSETFGLQWCTVWEIIQKLRKLGAIVSLLRSGQPSSKSATVPHPGSLKRYKENIQASTGLSTIQQTLGKMTEWWIEHHFNPRKKWRLVWYVLGEFSEVKYLEDRSPCYICCTPQTTQNFIQIKSALYLQTYTEVGVTASGPGQLSIIEGNMNLALWQKILKDNIRSSVGELKLKLKSVMQQDNDHKHESKSTSDWVGNKINAWGWLKV